MSLLNRAQSTVARFSRLVAFRVPIVLCRGRNSLSMLMKILRFGRITRIQHNFGIIDPRYLQESSIILQYRARWHYKKTENCTIQGDKYFEQWFYYNYQSTHRRPKWYWLTAIKWIPTGSPFPCIEFLFPVPILATFLTRWRSPGLIVRLVLWDLL